jgi:cytochrome c oxidase cbb3-type subunit III
MSSLSRCVLLSLLAACLSGCRSSANPLPAAAGGAPVGSPPQSAVSVNSILDRTNPLGRDPVSLEDGRRLFLWYNCYACHGPHGGGAIGPSLRDRVWRYGGSDAQIFASIAEGRPKGMPTWGRRIPEVQIWELVSYIRSLNTPNEPDPPQEPASEASGDTKVLTSASPASPHSAAGRQ